MKLARNEQFLADLRLDWPDFTLKRAKIGSRGMILARKGDTNPPITYCIATCDVP
jgi:hypothetical protein